MTTKLTPGAELVTILQPESAVAEAYKTLRTNLSLKEFDKELKVINIISSTAQESKSTTTLNLAYVYSQLEKRVLVIDMDLRLASVHKKLKLKNKLGVTDVVTRKCKFSDAVIHYTSNLDVLLSGTKTPYASEFVQSKVFREFIEACKKGYDIVLIDCPPINLVTDGMIVSTCCDGTVLCVAHGKSERKELEHTKDQLKQFKVNVVGIVMTRMPISKKKYYNDYGYGYGYTKNTK